ncbi:MAG: hypothetical protein M3O36_05095 [Myxococcota bacterium]|nr:hypothetical protein [Myxococcota bacterium]
MPDWQQKLGGAHKLPEQRTPTAPPLPLLPEAPPEEPPSTIPLLPDVGPAVPLLPALPLPPPEPAVVPEEAAPPSGAVAVVELLHAPMTVKAKAPSEATAKRGSSVMKMDSPFGTRGYPGAPASSASFFRGPSSCHSVG